jgi:hypothetical protein
MAEKVQSENSHFPIDVLIWILTDNILTYCVTPTISAL